MLSSSRPPLPLSLTLPFSLPSPAQPALFLVCCGTVHRAGCVRACRAPSGSQQNLPSSAMSHVPLTTSKRRTRYGKWCWRSWLRAVPPDSAPSPSSAAWEQGAVPQPCSHWLLPLPSQEASLPPCLQDGALVQGQNYSFLWAVLLWKRWGSPVQRRPCESSHQSAAPRRSSVCAWRNPSTSAAHKVGTQELTKWSLSCGSVFSLLDVSIGPVCWLWLG